MVIDFLFISLSMKKMQWSDCHLGLSLFTDSCRSVINRSVYYNLLLFVADLLVYKVMTYDVDIVVDDDINDGGAENVVRLQLKIRSTVIICLQAYNALQLEPKVS